MTRLAGQAEKGKENLHIGSGVRVGSTGVGQGEGDGRQIRPAGSGYRVIIAPIVIVDNHELKEEPNENMPNDDRTNVNHHGRTATRNFVQSGADHKEAFCAGGAPPPLT